MSIPPRTANAWRIIIRAEEKLKAHLGTELTAVKAEMGIAGLNLPVPLDRNYHRNPMHDVGANTPSMWIYIPRNVTVSATGNQYQKEHDLHVDLMLRQSDIKGGIGADEMHQGLLVYAEAIELVIQHYIRDVGAEATNAGVLRADPFDQQLLTADARRGRGRSKYVQMVAIIMKVKLRTRMRP